MGLCDVGPEVGVINPHPVKDHPDASCQLDAIIGKNRVDLVGHGLEHVLKELPGCLSVSSCDELGNRELGCPVDADEQVKLAFGRLHLCDVDVKEPNRIALDLLAPGLVALDIGQTRDTVPLKAPMQRRPCQVRD